ncbi:hypothetical protein [Chitinilyticum piscinae]|uniref:Uncharacterized protein n=1 Tax=Chitinilyticum piscinae TaxID=2866724 RepID=A0A8J7FG15_9NEIS|nr:hypothetical protein [Chitinilyticum piscinae]MBE9608718.1 hypothetical protein [Chitinilyticum piscinae]
MTRTLPLLVTTLLALCSWPALANPLLNCPEAESSALQQASAKVSRVAPHTLQIRWRRGVAQFTDQPPHDEPLSGRHWFYCGQDAASGLHLIRLEDGSLFSGVLFDPTSGRRIAAGHTVLLAPGRQHFLAIRQPDGLDGEAWLLRNRKNRTLWQGPNLITAGSRSLAELSDPHWNPQGKLAATLRCHSSPEQTHSVSLQSGQWQPLPECARQPR